ncbi:MBL fold metallo-hydrolase [Patescibacteria group bacterium]|nr:MBL fold metallo-hydrolase [Patescibacteria group bacterium]
MRISFHGATREVTGSCYLVEGGRSRVLIDCGMFQGSSMADAKNFRDFGFDASTIDAVVVTHAHLDHVGRIPKLIKNGFRGTVYATGPTAKLMKLVLEDAEKVMEDDLRRESRPKLYEREDVDQAMKRVKAVDYSRRVKLDGLSFRFRDAGHILGSSFVEIEEAGGARAAFSGDLGNVPDPILKPTAQLAAQDVLIMESTYGNRLHEELSERKNELQRAVEATIKRGGVLLIPAFAIERTQELLFELNHLVENGLIPKTDMYLDSPLAIKAGDIMISYPQYYNEDALKLVSMGDDLFSFPGLHRTLSRDESKVINEAPWPKIVIAGSGMMNGGRILHHLIRYLGNSKCTVLIIGYQAEGTLGRKLYRGEKRVDVLGERIDVKAKIVSIGGYSAHADQKQLVNWVRTAERLPGRAFCTHGEELAAAGLASRLKEDLGVQADVPRFEQTIDV